MHTNRLAPVPPAEDDAAILRGVMAVLASLDKAPEDGTTEVYRLGLRNEDGAIYRHLEVQGMPAVIAITGALRGLGFAAEPGAAGVASHGCQIVFSRPPAILPFGFARRRKVHWRSLQRPAEVLVSGGGVPATPGN